MTEKTAKTVTNAPSAKAVAVSGKSGKVISARRGRHSAYNYQFILDVGKMDRKSAESMLGKTVEWISPGKKHVSIKGKITRVHGGKGKVVAQFEKGLPGQSFGTSIAVA